MIVKKRLDALLIAKYFIDKSTYGNYLTNLKLQRVLYYTQLFHYTIKGDLLFNNKIKVVISGVTVEGVGEKYGKFNHDEIEEENNKEDFEIIEIETQEFLDKMWEILKNYTGKELGYLMAKEDFYQRALTNIAFGGYIDITKEDSRMLMGVGLDSSTKDKECIEDDRLDLVSKIYNE